MNLHAVRVRHRLWKGCQLNERAVDPPVDIDQGKIGKFSRRILEALPDPCRERVQDVWETLADGVKIAVANLGKLAGVLVTRLAVRDSSPNKPISPKNSPGLS